MAKIYAWLAGLVGVLLIVGVIYGKGRLDASHKAELQRVSTELQIAKDAMQREATARQQDAILASEASKREAALSLKITGLNDYVDTLEDRNRECLSGADTERLRDLWVR